MCAPKVMDIVRRELSRRELFRLASGAALGGAALALSPRAAAQTGLQLGTLADLTHTLSERFPVFPAFEPMRITTLVTVERDGFYANRWDLGEHSGTHMDAPAHFVAGAVTADRVPLESLIVPLAVIDISERANADPEATLTVEDIEAWEVAHGSLPAGAAVMMHSGWDARVDEPASFLNADESGVLRSPGFSPEAADFLVSERDISGIGVDTLSLDIGSSTTFEVHLTVLGAGKWGLEGVANLRAVPAAGATVIVGGPKVLDASGGPVRLMAAWA
ncbi:MAG: cyclase family protein [Deinococcota bacterium]|jgi:kynurenine formamidase|nr:cyclase family protein [Deinococcota bacterium]